MVKSLVVALLIFFSAGLVRGANDARVLGKDDFADFNSVLAYLKSYDRPDYEYLTTHLKFYRSNCEKASKYPSPTKASSGATISGIAFHRGLEAQIYLQLFKDVKQFSKNVSPWIPILKTLPSTDIKVGSRDLNLTGIKLKHREALADNARFFVGDLMQAIVQSDYKRCEALASFANGRAL